VSDLDRREFLASVAGGVAAAAVPAGATTAIGGAPPGPAGGLAEPEFRPLPIGAIRPAGWLERQLRIQRDGLTGHLDEFWPDVGQSQWFGGAAEGWERAPYWLDGAIPLAFILDDTPLKARIARYVDHIVNTAMATKRRPCRGASTSARPIAPSPRGCSRSSTATTGRSPVSSRATSAWPAGAS
jgi:hypothetical protein